MHHGFTLALLYSLSISTMAKLSLACIAALAAGASAFAPSQSIAKSSALKASEIWDPMGLYELGSGKAFDTFPNMFPNKQFIDDAEKKHGRMCMLAWTGVWATHEVRGKRRRTDREQFRDGSIYVQYGLPTRFVVGSDLRSTKQTHLY
jgi:hypothetical protein